MHDAKALFDLFYRDPAQSVYVILDGARDKDIYPGLQRYSTENRCLFAGELSRELAAAAPYLVRLKKNHPFTIWVIEHGWGDCWGVFLQSATNINELRRHFRRFLKVEDDKGKSLYFRFYDPRVLRTYLPTCVEKELDTVFGPVSRFFCEAADSANLHEFGFVEGKLDQKISPVPEKAGMTI